MQLVFQASNRMKSIQKQVLSHWLKKYVSVKPNSFVRNISTCCCRSDENDSESGSVSECSLTSKESNELNDEKKNHYKNISLNIHKVVK